MEERVPGQRKCVNVQIHEWQSAPDMLVAVAMAVWFIMLVSVHMGGTGPG